MRRRRHVISQRDLIPGELVGQVARVSLPLDKPSDLEPLLKHIGSAKYVLLGEASHGTSEYYRWRTLLSERLIRDKGFSFVAVEGDWPDCYRLNQFVKGSNEAGADIRDVLESFVRWPTWMWANIEIAGFAEWLRAYNKPFTSNQKIGFYGLDVYSLWDSLYAVLGYLRKSDPSLLPIAHRALACFQPYGEDVQQYARATALVPSSCEDEVVDLLAAMRRNEPQNRSVGTEEYFTAEQNAFVIKNAEAYYRAMIRGGPDSWNLRDQHMTDTLDRLMRHHGPNAKAIVWEHNTHIGDARYTDMTDEGMFNVGQLVRERHSTDGVFLVGFSSYSGTVIAAEDWEAPMEKMRVPPARNGSWEDILHRAGPSNKLLLLEAARKSDDFMAVRGHRAIGVVYHPDYEQFGNYVPTILPQRYDAFCFVDETQALHPLHLHPAMEEVPETYPFGV